MTDCPLSGRGQGHVSNLYIVDLGKSLVWATGVINELVDGRCADAWRYSVSWLNAQVYYTLVDCNPSNCITALCSGFVVHVVPALLCRSWQDFHWHVASRGLSAIAELLVEIRKRTDRQTYTHTLIAILRTPAECEIKKTINRHNLHSCPIYDDDEWWSRVKNPDLNSCR